MNLDSYRKDAKRLVRAFEAGAPEAVDRASRALGARARDRFLLSDAQHVIAVERGYTSWPELRRSLAAARSETAVSTGLEYRPGEPIAVRVVRRDRRISVTDDGSAIEKARRAPGWRAVAERIARLLDVNISRDGVVSLPVVPAGPGLEAIVNRISEASLALYQEVLELED